RWTTSSHPTSLHPYIPTSLHPYIPTSLHPHILTSSHPTYTPSTVEQRLAAYGELAVRVALNLQPGQRLLVIGPLMNGGASLEAAPLVRHIAASAYRAGAPPVEASWGDEELQIARFTHGP